MKHPFIDDFRFSHAIFEVIYFIDRIINFFNHYYITTNEGFSMFPLRDVRPHETGVNGHIEIYTGEEREFMPKYIKIPIVRIVYDNRKWCHWTSDYNHTIAVTISDNPKPLQKHKFKDGELTEEQFNKFLKFIADNIEPKRLLKMNEYSIKKPQHHVVLGDEAHKYNKNLKLRHISFH